MHDQLCDSTSIEQTSWKQVLCFERITFHGRPSPMNIDVRVHDGEDASPWAISRLGWEYTNEEVTRPPTFPAAKNKGNERGVLFCFALVSYFILCICMSKICSFSNKQPSNFFFRQLLIVWLRSYKSYLTIKLIILKFILHQQTVLDRSKTTSGMHRKLGTST